MQNHTTNHNYNHRIKIIKNGDNTMFKLVLSPLLFNSQCINISRYFLLILLINFISANIPNPIKITIVIGKKVANTPIISPLL